MSHSRMRTPLRAGLLASAVAAICLASAAVAQAATLPTVSIALTPTSASVGGTLESGAANVVTTDTGVKEATVILVLLKSDVSIAEGEAFAAEKKTKGDPNNASKIGSIVFDVGRNPEGKSRSAVLPCSRADYLVLVGAGEGEAERSATHFTVTASKSRQALPTHRKRS